MKILWLEIDQNTTISTSCSLFFLTGILFLFSCAGSETRGSAPPSESQKSKQEEVPSSPELEDLKGYLVPDS